MSLQKWQVWDALNADGEDDDFYTVLAFDSASAAIVFAENSDGLCDGLFVDCSQPIAVRDPKTAEVRVFDVRAEMVPVFRATESTETR